MFSSPVMNMKKVQHKYIYGETTKSLQFYFIKKMKWLSLVKTKLYIFHADFEQFL